MDIQVGDILTLKKPHPCGSREWTVLRVGADFRIRCAGCSHEVMRPRVDVERAIKSIRRNGEEIKPARRQNT